MQRLSLCFIDCLCESESHRDLQMFEFEWHTADFQNVSCFVLEQNIMFHKATVQNDYNVYYFKTLSICIFNAVKKQPGIGYIVDALFDNFVYLHNLYTVVVVVCKLCRDTF